MATKLQRSQMLMLLEAAAAPQNGWDGVIAKGARRKTAKRLEDEGLLRYVAHGVEEDGPTDNEFPIYAITAAGLAALQERGEYEGPSPLALHTPPQESRCQGRDPLTRQQCARPPHPEDILCVTELGRGFHTPKGIVVRDRLKAAEKRGGEAWQQETHADTYDMVALRALEEAKAFVRSYLRWEMTDEELHETPFMTFVVGLAELAKERSLSPEVRDLIHEARAVDNSNTGSRATADLHAALEPFREVK